jgi:hypothetical protein
MTYQFFVVTYLVFGWRAAGAEWSRSAPAAVWMGSGGSGAAPEGIYPPNAGWLRPSEFEGRSRSAPIFLFRLSPVSLLSLSCLLRSPRWRDAGAREELAVAARTRDGTCPGAKLTAAGAELRRSLLRPAGRSSPKPVARSSPPPPRSRTSRARPGRWRGSPRAAARGAPPSSPIQGGRGARPG